MIQKPARFPQYSIFDSSLKKEQDTCLYLAVLKGSDLIGLTRASAKGAKSTCTNCRIPTPWLLILILEVSLNQNHFSFQSRRIKILCKVLYNVAVFYCAYLSSWRAYLCSCVNQFWMKSGTFMKHFHKLSGIIFPKYWGDIPTFKKQSTSKEQSNTNECGFI